MGYIERRRLEDREPTESQKNGALRDLTNFLIFKSSSIRVQEATNTAAVMLGMSREFGSIPIEKLPELAQWTADKQLQRGVVQQMMNVLATAELPSAAVAAGAGVTAERLRPVVEHVASLIAEGQGALALEDVRASEDPQGVFQLEAAPRAAGADMVPAPRGPAVGAAPNILSRFQRGSPASYAEALSEDVAEPQDLVNAQQERDIRSFLSLLLIAIPILLASALQGTKGVAILLLLFFVALLNGNRRLAADVFQMLENASRRTP